MNLRISDKRTQQRIRRLQKQTEAANPAEVVRRALQLYDLMTSQTSKGAGVVLCERDGVEREVMVV